MFFSSIGTGVIIKNVGKFSVNVMLNVYSMNFSHTTVKSHLSLNNCSNKVHLIPLTEIQVSNLLKNATYRIVVL